MFLFFETPLTLSPRLALPVGARLASSPVAAAAGPPVVDAALTEPTAEDGYRSRADLKRGIASFYDGSSALWERVWGEHMHHGYYPAGSKRKDHVQAQSDMIDEVLLWARGGGEAAPRRVLDVGCGVGGSTRHIARAFGCDGVGITLSPYQAKRANELSAAAGLGDQLSFQVADALEMPFPDESFDLVWSLESGEHMPDKEKFVSELTRVLRPGGRLILVAWTHRDLVAGEAELRPEEQRLLRRISRAYYLPRWCSVADYTRLLTAKGMGGMRRDDWTSNVARFWPAVIASSFRPKSILGPSR